MTPDQLLDKVDAALVVYGSIKKRVDLIEVPAHLAGNEKWIIHYHKKLGWYREASTI